MQIAYGDAAAVSVDEAIELYNRSTLGERRPVDRPDISYYCQLGFEHNPRAWMLKGSC